MNLKWIEFARGLLGVKEIKGGSHNKKIIEMLDTAFGAVGTKKWINDDETPWCGTFAAYVLAECGLTAHIPKNFFRAREWAKAGSKLDSPAYGCVVVFTRKGGGHVGFVVGQDQHGRLLVLGGNQGDQVSIRPFPRTRVLAYRWCGNTPVPEQSCLTLPRINNSDNASENEA